jgi:chemotaxis protein methyltransferase CheR
MENELYEKYCKLIYKISGIHLGKNKQTLVEGRIAKRLKAVQMSSYEEYLKFVSGNVNEQNDMLDVISTNVTHFYREERHFTILHDIIKDLAASGQRKFRVWCAAASSGEEPYTIAMTIKDALAGKEVDLKILASDISRPVLKKFKVGRYPQEALSKLPPHLVTNYMVRDEKHRHNDDTFYSMSEEIKELMIIKRINLSTPPFPMKGGLDIIFIRNVMIYFDDTVKEKLINDAYRLLKPGGYLFIGHSESLSGISHEFKLISPATYRK